MDMKTTEINRYPVCEFTVTPSGQSARYLESGTLQVSLAEDDVDRLYEAGAIRACSRLWNVTAGHEDTVLRVLGVEVAS